MLPETPQARLQPYISQEKGRMFAERKVLAFVAGILLMWDMEPINPHGWVVPEPRTTTGLAVPLTNLRVRLRRRTDVSVSLTFS